MPARLTRRLVQLPEDIDYPPVKGPAPFGQSDLPSVLPEEFRADLLFQTADGLVQVLSDKLPISLSATKNCFDFVCVAISTTVSLLYFHRLEGIGLGTVLMAILVGRALWLFTKLFGQALERFLYGEEQDVG
ncbi:MAG: hypothetical protein IKO22_00655 [Oscillospiraceae bacterium]|nr:hypothetical protein [Oscillospiraceae bacterium]